MPPTSEIERIAAAALAEDGAADLTSELTVPSGLPAEGRIEYRSGGVLAGTGFADAVARACGCSIAWRIAEGGDAERGMVVGVVRGELGHILRAERPLLNLLQRASGIAAATRAFVAAVEGTGCRILHTRKTAPGLRALDVAGVIAGGGQVHRMDLAHEVMVKDNHWQALGRGGAGLSQALLTARRRGVTALYVEVESLDQVEEACAAGATRLLIDNQSPRDASELGGAGPAAFAGDRDRGNRRYYAGKRASLCRGGGRLHLHRCAHPQCPLGRYRAGSSITAIEPLEKRARGDSSSNSPQRH